MYCYVGRTEATNAAFEEIEEIGIPKPASERGRCISNLSSSLTGVPRLC
jgi:hypothetical protein